MSAPENAPLDATTADPVAAVLLERLADRLGARAPGTIVFGEPVVRQNVTVIPVARIGFGVGFAGRADQEAGEEGPVGVGGEAKPLGFIEITEGRATYKPIRDPWVNVLAPLAGGLLVGAAGASVLRRLAR